MRLSWIVFCGFWAAAVLIATAGQATIAAGDAASKPAASRPASRDSARVVATIDKVKITAGQVDKLVKNFYGELDAPTLAQARKDVIEQLVMEHLFARYIDTHKCTPTPQEIKDAKDKLRAAAANTGLTWEQFLLSQQLTEQMISNRVGLLKLVKKIATPKAVEAVIKEHPEYFNLTKVELKHIVIASGPLDARDKQAAALKKARKILADIQAGKIKFEDAARKYSDETLSGRHGGTWNVPLYFSEFDFPVFAEKVFAMKPGQVLSEIVLTPQGYHIVKLTSKVETKAKPGPEATMLAKNYLVKRMQCEVVLQTYTTCPVTIDEAFVKPPAQP